MVEGTRGGQDARGGATSNGVGAAARLRTRMRIADERGWTLMEVLVACSMIAILTGIAVPQYTQVALQMRTSAAATQMVSDLNYAREMAQRTGVPHYINVIAGSSVNYRVQRAAAPPAINPSTDPVVRRQDLTNRIRNVQFALNGASTDPYGTAVTTPTPAGQLVFSPRGLPSTPGAYFVSSSDGQYRYAVSVTGAGRIRLFSRRPDGVWW
jgi:Tfp pilus assembly protein FimT